MSELESLSAMFEQLGAKELQAKVMAAQLMKRADQIAEERGVDRMVALAGLLELVRSGREGETYESPDSKGGDGLE